MTLLDQLNRFIAPIQRRLSVLLSKAILRSISDTTGLPIVKVVLGQNEIKEGLEYVQPYGFTSVPESGAEALVGFIGGNRDNGVIIVVGDSRTRKKGLAAGDVAVYHKEGDYILLASDRIEIHSSKKVVVDCQEVVLGGTAPGPTAGVVTGECICAFTGAPHPDTSARVKAVK